jgi:hypothetical protein
MLLRSLLATLATILLLFPSQVSARQDLEKTLVEIDGFPLSLSPDGSWIAGLDTEGRAFCVWNVDSMEPSCDGALPDLVETTSLAWSPDSTAVAFSLGSVNRLVDSDIYVFEAASGTLHNLTDDDPGNTGADEVTLITPQEGIVAIDRFPAWSPDGDSLVFARTLWGDADAAGVSMMTIPLAGGEPEERAVIEASAALPVVGPMIWRADETILFSTRHPDPQNEMNGLWMLQPGGSLTRLLDGTAGSGITEPVIADIATDGQQASVYSRLESLESLGQAPGIFFHVDLDNGTATPWEDYSGVALAEEAVLFAPPIFGPENAVALLFRTPNGDMTLSILDPNGDFQDVASIDYQIGRPPSVGTNGVQPTVIWAQDGTLLVILATGGTIIATESPAGTPGAMSIKGL